MNQIISSFMDTHIKEYGLNNFSHSNTFEHFINRIIINKYSFDRFDPKDIMTNEGEIGLDGIGIIVNDMLIIDEDDLDEAVKLSNKLVVKFVFIQAKTSDCFDGNAIGTFFFGVKAFFTDETLRPKTNEKIETLIHLKDRIYDKSIDFASSPQLELYYVSCGKWNENNNLSERVMLEKEYFVLSGDFGAVNFYPYDNDKIINSYKELKKKISKQFTMEKRFSFPPIAGIEQSYTGLIKCKDFVNILQDSDGEMLKNIFEDNVRDFQGYNLVNKEIKATIENQNSQKQFAILNNGITIVAKDIDIIGDEVEIFDFQIVNGCQTSYVLFDSKHLLNENSYILAKVIQVVNADVLNSIIYTTNRQTEVKSEAFASTKPFHKKLEDYYNSVDINYRLYYERRSKQYDLADDINKNSVVTLSGQIHSYIAMFLNEPHSTHRYYGELLEAYKNKIFQEDDLPDPYYIAAYFANKVNNYMQRMRIFNKYKWFRYHIVCAMRALCVGKDILAGNSRQLKRNCEELIKVSQDSSKIEKFMDIAVSCLEEAISRSGGIDKNSHRSREFTSILLEVVSQYSAALNNNEYLKVGDEVTCIVRVVRDYYAEVYIKTSDYRNYGEIHISKIARRYINNVKDELKIGDTIKAKILKDDFFENGYGWSLSMILD